MQPLPDGTHLIHIGPQKTGSTSLQLALHRSRAALADLGVHYAGDDVKPKGRLGLGRNDHEKWIQGKVFPDWELLREQVHAGDPRLVVVSLEAFGRADDARAAKVVRELGGEHPHVVAVARRYDRLMPSQWQQRVKSSALRMTYESWLELILGDPAPDDFEWRAVWQAHGTADLVRRWTEVVGAENFTLVVPPDRDRRFVPGAFATLLDVPRELLELRGGGPVNSSLSYSETELIRRLNVFFHDQGWGGNDHYVLVRDAMSRKLVRVASPVNDPPIPLPPRWAWDRLVELSAQRIADLRASDIRVVGDLEDLRVLEPETLIESVPAVEVIPLDTAVAALEQMGRAAVKRDRRSARRKRKTARDLRRQLHAARAVTTRPDDTSAARRLAVRARRRLRRGSGRADTSS